KAPHPILSISVSLCSMEYRKTVAIPNIFPPVAIATARLPFLISCQLRYDVTNSNMAKNTMVQRMTTLYLAAVSMKIFSQKAAIITELLLPITLIQELLHHCRLHLLIPVCPMQCGSDFLRIPSHLCGAHRFLFHE